MFNLATGKSTELFQYQGVYDLKLKMHTPDGSRSMVSDDPDVAEQGALIVNHQRYTAFIL